MSSHRRLGKREEGIERFQKQWPSLQNTYISLTEYVFQLCADMLLDERLLGHVRPRPRGAKSLESALKTLQKKVDDDGKHFPRMRDVIFELDDLAGVTIATTTTSSWKPVARWLKKKFVTCKPTKCWNGDSSVYKYIRPVSTNYTALHFRLRLGSELARQKPELEHLVIEIQLKTEDTASYNNIAHPFLYKNDVPVSESGEMMADFTALIMQTNQMGSTFHPFSLIYISRSIGLI